MRTKSLLVMLGIASLVAAGPASANGFFTDSYTGLGYVDEDEVDDETFSSHFSVGYAFSENWGAEIGYVSFGDFEGSSDGIDGSLELDGFSAGINLFAPLDNDWYIGGHGGAWFWDGEVELSDGTTTIEFDDDGTDFYAGVSVGYNFFERWSAGLGFTYYGYDVTGDDDADFDSGVYIVGFHTHYRFK